MTDTPSQIITRFAPSPTGYLHIGGARTALFNWIYAKKWGGKFLLRIEDTDRKRHNPAAVNAILDGLMWLGLEWDDTPISQFERAKRHADIAKKMVENGSAYYCYTPQEEIAKLKEDAAKNNMHFQYKSPWREHNADPRHKNQNAVIRLKAPTDGETIVEDCVQGRVTVQNKEIDDMVLLRSDGSPTYMLAVVVDDYEMAITHIIRGVDHLTNAARQILIYKAMNWQVPVMAHIPLIHGADGAKLSKRHGALGVEAYQDMGYLPEALCNYLARLGWSHGNDEIFSREQMINWFDIIDINKSAARFDFEKLGAINSQYIKLINENDLIAQLRNLGNQNSNISTLARQLFPKYENGVRILLPALKDRAKTLHDVIFGAEFLCDETFAIDDKAAACLTPNTLLHLDLVHKKIQDIDETNWYETNLQLTIRKIIEDNSVTFGELATPLRAALTGKTTSPSLSVVMAALGKQKSIERMKAQLNC